MNTSSLFEKAPPRHVKPGDRVRIFEPGYLDEHKVRRGQELDGKIGIVAPIWEKLDPRSTPVLVDGELWYCWTANLTKV